MTHIHLVTKFLDGVAGADADQLRPIVTDDFELHVLPASLGMPSLTKDGIDAMVNNVVATFGAGVMKFKLNQVYETEDNTLIVHGESDATSKKGTPWHNEYIYIVETSPEGDKIKKFTEFLDSKFYGAFGAAQAAKA